MSYAVQDDMVNRFGNDEMVALTDRDQDGVINATILQQALDTAGAQIDTYLSSRYVLPMQIVPKFLVTVCCDIARYQLCVGSTRGTEEIETRNKDAVRFLELAASGKVTLGVTPVGQVQSSNTIEFNGGSMVFSSRDRGAF